MKEHKAFEITRYEQLVKKLETDGSYTLTPIIGPHGDGISIHAPYGNLGEIVQKSFLIIYSQVPYNDFQKGLITRLTKTAREFC